VTVLEEINENAIQIEESEERISSAADSGSYFFTFSKDINNVEATVLR
jgi:hypothetical protein